MENNIFNELAKESKIIYEINNPNVLEREFIDDFSVAIKPKIEIEQIEDDKVEVTYYTERRTYKHINECVHQESCGYNDYYETEDYDLDYNNYDVTEQKASIYLSIKQLREAVKVDFENWLD